MERTRRSLVESEMQIQVFKRLQDALEAIKAIECFLTQQSVENVLGSDILQAAVELVLRQTEVIPEEWAREDLGDQIQAAVANALGQQFSG